MDCTSLTCRNGSCPGCRNYQSWCADPRCAPYCPGCAMDTHHDYACGLFVFVVVLVILAMALFLYLASRDEYFRKTWAPSRL